MIKPTVKCSKCNGSDRYVRASGIVTNCNKCEGGLRYTRVDAVRVARERLAADLATLRAQYAAEARIVAAVAAGRRTTSQVAAALNRTLEAGIATRRVYDYLGTVTVLGPAERKTTQALGRLVLVPTH